MIFQLTACGETPPYSYFEYFHDPRFFHLDEVYEKCNIDGSMVDIHVLSATKNEHLENNNFNGEKWENHALKTVVYYRKKDQKILYISPPSTDIPAFFKSTNSIDKKGKLYLHRLEFGGGSGHLSQLYHVTNTNGKIELQHVLDSDELSQVYFNKNDNEILCFQWIYSDDKNNFGDLIESHFSDHRVELIQVLFQNGTFHINNLGRTSNRFPMNADENFQSILRDIGNQKKGSPTFKRNDFLEWNNFTGKMIQE